MTDYGYGLTVDWTPDELAKIEKYRACAVARRMLGLSNDGKSIRMFLRKPENEAILRRIAKEVYGTTTAQS